MPTSDRRSFAPTAFNELGFYTLGGAATSPRDLIAECHQAEALGIGAAFLSERFNVKEALTSCGAIGACTERLGIATAATNHNTRHPMVLAAHATTMHRLTGGRYMLGLGRGLKPLLDAFGLSRVTTAQMEAFIALLRRLWRGERVQNYDGPIGKFPALQLDPNFNEDIPVGVMAFGPNTLDLAGRVCDAVVLHTYFTDETTTRVVRAVRQAAERAGRNPAEVRIWSVFATLGDHLDPMVRLKKSVGRIATYLQVYGDLLVETNRWDRAILKRFREAPIIAQFKGWVDAKASPSELEQIAELIPAEWLAPSATGTPEQCAQKILGQFDLGVDGVILHGATPQELVPILPAYAALRPPGRFNDLPANPGGRRLAAGPRQQQR
jgi:probable F420-dependent oxidoreductase